MLGKLSQGQSKQFGLKLFATSQGYFPLSGLHMQDLFNPNENEFSYTNFCRIYVMPKSK